LTEFLDSVGGRVRRGGQSAPAPSGQTRLGQTLGDRLGPAVTFATTEHFNLQTARATTVSEANGRASIYLAAVSSNLIALAFIGQMSRLGTAFYVSALIVLPVLAFVGVVTFQRLVQSSVEDIAYARRIARLREFYLEVAPEVEPYGLAPVRATPRRSCPQPCSGAWDWLGGDPAHRSGAGRRR
jgi:hypothetical protein